MNQVIMVVPTIAKDVPKLLGNIDLYFSFLPIKGICVVAPPDVESLLPTDARISFIPETDVVDFATVESLILKKGGVKASKRAGWYVQQFIKLAYSRITNDDYYLLWDSDTVPVKNILLFNEDGVPYLDYKTEYHQPYFDTIAKLLPGFHKEFNGSFISEHMLVETSVMQDLLLKIESNNSIEGSSFVEKIINAVDAENLSKSGFSEFESFGTYVYKKHRERYIIREWHSMRSGAFFFDGSKSLSKDTLNWLAQNYDAISFEKGDSISLASSMIQKELYRKVFKSSFLDVLSFIIKGFRKVLRTR